MQAVESEITINADIQTVWEILEDFDNYHTWNDFCPKIETNKVIGGPFIMTVNLTPGKKPVISKEIFSDYEAPHVVGWKLDWGFLLKTHRIQELKQIDENTTHYYTIDKFWGLLTPLVMWLHGKNVKRGFDFVSKALKEASEKKFQEKQSIA